MTAVTKVIPIARTSEECHQFLKALPRLSINELPPGDCCPICFNSFATILEGEPSTSEERLGVTKLQCGHVFCIADIAEWIRASRGSCPTCRDLFLVIPEPSDDESSDGGEYIPGSDSVADDMMDGETWTDEDGEIWTDDEDMSLDEGITEGETDSSWERSSDGGVVGIDEIGMPAVAQIAQTSMDNAIITEAYEGSSLAVPHDDPGCEQINTELVRWRSQIDNIQLHDWVSKKEETRTMIHQAFCALNALKPRIDSLDRDTPAKLSFMHYALTTMQELHRAMELKLEMIHDVDQYLSTREGGL